MSRILLVEDSAVQRRAIGDLLESVNHQVDYATNGREALQYLAERQPDLVVTDLEMPEVDGLSLVRQIATHRGKLPIILMTAHGSEEIAAEALRAGAASYVPKAELQQSLLQTVRELLEVASQAESYERLLACATRAEFDFELDNDPALVAPLVDLLQQMIESTCNLRRGERLRLGVALEQALLNAMFRGNIELPGPAAASADNAEFLQRREQSPYAQRRVRVGAAITPEHVRLVVEDEGPGFDVQTTLASSHLQTSSGRGLVLMQAFMDRVTFNDRGNQVVLEKHCKPELAATAPAITEASVPMAAVSTAPQLVATASPSQLEPAADTQVAQVPTVPTPTAPTVRPTVRSSGLGRLVPADSGEPVILLTNRIVIGRDKSCDVVVPFPEVSAHHCQLFLYSGWWYVKDLHTKNGIRVNGASVVRRRLSPGDTLSVANKHRFTIDYDPGDLGALGPTPPPDPF